MNLEILEIALKKRWHYPYVWGRKQNNDWDKKTNFIYKTRTFSDLLKIINDFNTELKDYSLNRWYNYWSAMGVEYIFSKHNNVIPNKDIYDKLVDFSIGNISFDHKTSIFPNGYGKSYEYAKNNKKDLIEWLYNNQSQQGRKHLKNRLFIILYDSSGNEHWKLKAEIKLLEQGIKNYMSGFSINNLISLNFGEGEILTDIIWINK